MSRAIMKQSLVVKEIFIFDVMTQWKWLHYQFLGGATVDIVPTIHKQRRYGRKKNGVT